MRITAEKGYGASFSVKVDMLHKSKVIRDHAQKRDRGWHIHISDIDNVEITIDGTSKELHELSDVLAYCIGIIDKRETKA